MSMHTITVPDEQQYPMLLALARQDGSCCFMRTFLLGILLLAHWVFNPAPGYAQVRPEIKKLARQIAADSTVDSERVGRGFESSQYRQYTQLLALASDAELLALTDHRSPAVRSYAYQGMCSRNSPVLLATLRKHAFDTAAVVSQAGCFRFNLTVAEQMRQYFEVRQEVQPVVLTAADTLLLAGIEKVVDDRLRRYQLRRKKQMQR